MYTAIMFTCHRHTNTKRALQLVEGMPQKFSFEIRVSPQTCADAFTPTARLDFTFSRPDCNCNSGTTTTTTSTMTATATVTLMMTASRLSEESPSTISVA